MWFCRNCETLNEENNNVCLLCGTRRMQPASATKAEKAEPQTGANYRFTNQIQSNIRQTGENEKRNSNEEDDNNNARRIYILLFIGSSFIVCSIILTIISFTNSSLGAFFIYPSIGACYIGAIILYIADRIGRVLPKIFGWLIIIALIAYLIVPYLLAFSNII